MDRGPWRARVCGVAKSQTQLRDRHFHFSLSAGAALVCPNMSTAPLDLS